MQMRSEETRARILQTAMKLFAERGYDATGVAEICKAASLSKGAFYHHFQTKQALFLHLLTDWLKGIEADLALAVREAPNMAEGLLGMAARTSGIFTAADGRLSIFLEFWAQARKDPEVWRRTIEPFRLYRQMFAEMIRRGVEEGSFRPVDDTLAAQAIVSLAVGVILQGVVDPQGAEWGKVTQEAVRLLIDGIGRR